MLEGIGNFLPLSESLLTGGMPTAGQIEAAAGSGVQVVINLALEAAPSALPGERELVESLGMIYINIPVPWNSPGREDLETFMDAMDAHKGKTILVHCEANYRATAFHALYRVLRQGWKRDAALDVMHRVWNEEKYPIWKKFIIEMISTEPV